MLEAFDLNPFLTRFYEDPSKFALETEFGFLLIHYHQLKTASLGDHEEIISDFHLSKDLVYTNLNLAGSSANRVFHELYGLLMTEVRSPDVLVSLTAGDDLLISRIRERNRTFEMRVDPDYYVRLNAAYEEFFQKYKGRKIEVNADKWDFVQNPSLFSDLSARIDACITSKQ